MAPIFLVGIKYWFWERTLHGDETGHQAKMPLIGRTYTKTFELIYLPSNAIVQPLARRLPVGGVGINLAADLVAVVLQNICILFFWRSWKIHSRRSKCRYVATNKT